MQFRLRFSPIVAPTPHFDPGNAVNQVGLDLYRQLAIDRRDGNLVLSPYSVESAFALAYCGADGVTREELARALYFPPDDDVLQSAFASLASALDEVAARSTTTVERLARWGEKSDPIEWRAANRLFGQRGGAFRDEFVARMRDGFKAPFEAIDFRNGAERARGTINAWVEEQTKRRIKDLIPLGGIDRNTSLVLVNALYLKAPWETEFTAAQTRSLPFHLRPGETRDVPTMRRTGFLGYADEGGMRVVSLDYQDEGLHFIVVLPPPRQTVDDVAGRLAPQDFVRWAQLGQRSTPPKFVDLYLPKFRVEGHSIGLGDALRGLGVRSAFDDPPGSANFERIMPRQPGDYLSFSEVFHQVFLAIDEKGTEAAAATAMAMRGGAARIPTPVEFRIDRPFLFAIQHRKSGACLFLGRIGDPRE